MAGLKRKKSWWTCSKYLLGVHHVPTGSWLTRILETKRLSAPARNDGELCPTQQTRPRAPTTAVDGTRPLTSWHRLHPKDPWSITWKSLACFSFLAAPWNTVTFGWAGVRFLARLWIFITWISITSYLEFTRIKITACLCTLILAGRWWATLLKRCYWTRQMAERIGTKDVRAGQSKEVVSVTVYSHLVHKILQYARCDWCDIK